MIPGGNEPWNSKWLFFNGVAFSAILSISFASLPYMVMLCFKDRNFHFTTLWSWIYSQFSQRRGLYIHNLLSNQWLSDIFTTVFHQRFPPVRTRPCVKFAVGEINIIRIAGKKIFFSAFFSWAETAPPGKLDANKVTKPLF